MSKYIIISKHKVSDAFSVAKDPRIHETLGAAEAEARRLASTNEEKVFIVVNLDIAYSATKVSRVII